MCKLCLQVCKHMHVSTHVFSCMWRSGVNVENHPLLLFHLVHRGKASQSNLEHASVSSSNSPLALGIHCSCLWRLELQVGAVPTWHFTWPLGVLNAALHLCSKRVSHWAISQDFAQVLKLFSQLRNYSAPLNLHFSICKMEGCTSSQSYAGVLSKLIHIPNVSPCLVNGTYYYLVQNHACVPSSSWQKQKNNLRLRVLKLPGVTVKEVDLGS